MTDYPHGQPPQRQSQPGHESAMQPPPVSIRDDYRGAGKLAGKCALISGGDSGIGRAIALHFAREGADVAIVYLEEDEDAERTRRLVEAEGRRCHSIAADIGSPQAAREVAERALAALGRLDLLINHAGEQHQQSDFEAITPAQLESTFRTNFYAMFWLTQAVLPYLRAGSAIVNTSSITGARGNPVLMDYAASKGAILSFTFSLARQLAERGIRVNAVAPGPIWTPLIPASFPPQKVESFGTNTLMKRAGQPAEVAPAYVFLAGEDASYVTGQVIHVNGGKFMAA